MPTAPVVPRALPARLWIALGGGGPGGPGAAGGRRRGAEAGGAHLQDGQGRRAGQSLGRRSSPSPTRSTRSCAEAPTTRRPNRCQEVGGVDYRYGIGQLEVTVAQWVAFLNTVDPTGRNRHRLYSANESADGLAEVRPDRLRRKAPAPAATTRWPRRNGPTSPTASPTSCAPPASPTRSTTASCSPSGRAPNGGFRYVTYRVRLSRRTEDGMYEMAEREATRSHKTGFVIPSQDEWIKAAYYDPNGGGTYSYWKYPTNPGVFGDGTDDRADPDARSTRRTGNVTNASTQPLATFHACRKRRPRAGARRLRAGSLRHRQPLRHRPEAYGKAFQGSLSTVGQAKTPSPWGTLDQGGNAVEWTDTITPPPFGRQGRPRLAPPARRHRQRPRLPALALGGRPAAAGQRLLHRHLPVARHPHRRDRQPEARRMRVGRVVNWHAYSEVNSPVAFEN